ncbi:MAG TPA: 4-hydroxy-tetrahydrodipicolinate synthase [Chryseosolibacter sp.]|nr:4-hydroxy-tetrahydrodipicolinate synthase [Chryseosolibacter sp.]
MEKLHGTGVALVTPFTDNQEVDFNALKKLLDHTAQGVDYYVVMGTTGEPATLERGEKKSILQFVKDNNSKGLPIVYGAGGNNTKQVIDAIKETDLTGVDAILSVSPYYNKPSQEGIYQHFVAIADASPVPVILYNVPGRTASNMSAETTLRLAQHPNIAGIKEASGNLEQCMRIARDKPEGFLLISGDDMMTLALYAHGANGVISVLANAYPLLFRAVKEHSLAGNYAQASEQMFKLLDLNPLMYEEGNPVGLKVLLKQMGICSSVVRLPLAHASESLTTRILSRLVKK